MQQVSLKSRLIQCFPTSAQILKLELSYTSQIFAERDFLHFHFLPFRPFPRRVTNYANYQHNHVSFSRSGASTAFSNREKPAISIASLSNSPRNTHTILKQIRMKIYDVYLLLSQKQRARNCSKASQR